MQITKPSSYETITEPSLEFKINGEVCAGYATKDKKTPFFPPHLREIQSKTWAQNMEAVKQGLKTGPHYNEITYTQKVNAQGICECGQTIELWDQYLGTCECPHCHRWYNLFGQELNPPETWNAYEY